MNTAKIKTYVGFAIKSGKIVYGVDNFKTLKIKLIFISDSISLSSMQKCKNFADKSKCTIKQIKDDELNDIINNKNIKAFGITDGELAKAILNNF